MLCHFSQEFPPFVAKFLDSGRLLRRRFREESITDLIMAGLIAVGGGHIIVEFPDEPITGADMQWDIVNIKDNTFFRVILQAKQLYGGGLIWSRHYYKELLKKGKKNKLQAQVLCDTARNALVPTYPLYILYNSETSCELSRQAEVYTVDGVNLADGFAIEALVRAANNRQLRTRYKSLGRIEPFLQPLQTLFCPTITERFGARSVSSGLPQPADIRGRLVVLRRKAKKSAEQNDLPIPEVSEVPEVAEGIPADVQRIIRYYRERDDQVLPRIHRWRVIFVSDGLD